MRLRKLYANRVDADQHSRFMPNASYKHLRYIGCVNLSSNIHLPFFHLSANSLKKRVFDKAMLDHNLHDLHNPENELNIQIDSKLACCNTAINHKQLGSGSDLEINSASDQDLCCLDFLNIFSP